jgi:signal peptidase II
MLYAIIVAAAVALDQLFKYWIVKTIELGGELPLLPGIIHLTYIRNTGAAFSIFENMRWMLIAVTVISIAAIIIFMIKGKMGRASKICAALVLGGAVGNAIDRIFIGYVVDMFCTDFITFPVFNVADCFIVVGGILFCLFYILDIKKSELEPLAPANDTKSDSHDD